MAEAVAKGLRAEGYVVDLAHDGPGGLEAARFGEYDAVVLDIMLPGMSGYTVVKTLREEGNWVPVLMLSAKDGEYDQADALYTTLVQADPSNETLAFNAAPM